MRRRIYLRPETEEEIGEAVAWYRERGPGLGVAFLDEVPSAMEALAVAPDRYPIVEGEIRKAVLRRFPHVILFRSTDEETVVIACFHTRRTPGEWRRRV